MTELLEGFVPPDLAIAEKHDKDDCPFCKKDEPDQKETVYVGSADDLGDDLKDAPVWKFVVEGNTEVTSVPNAHHLIPAEATLHGERAHASHPSGKVLPEHGVIKYMSKGANGSKVNGDIGYNVNKEHNGVWLPSIPEAFKKLKDREGKDEFIGVWSGLSPVRMQAIADVFMENTGHQWHQTHKDYSNRVEKWLNNFVARLESETIKSCPEAAPDGDKKLPPPFGLLSRLRGLSGFLRSHLKGSPSSWCEPLFTSTLAKNLAKKRAGT